LFNLEGRPNCSVVGLGLWGVRGSFIIVLVFLEQRGRCKLLNQFRDLKAKLRRVSLQIIKIELFASAKKLLRWEERDAATTS